MAIIGGVLRLHGLRVSKPLLRDELRPIILLSLLCLLFLEGKEEHRLGSLSKHPWLIDGKLQLKCCWVCLNIH